MSAVLDGYVPLALFGKDHWSTLAYIETVMVDCAFFQVGADARMRSSRRNFRVMQRDCPRPKRCAARPSIGMAMERSEGSRLADGSVIPDHDDWACVQDMAQAGLLTVGADGVQPGAKLRLSALGHKVTALLREHKAAGGLFATFKVTP